MWKRLAAVLQSVGERELRIAGAVMIIVGLLALQLVRARALKRARGISARSRSSGRGRHIVSSFEDGVMGKSVVILGAQWGDEGKGKIVDLLTEEVGAVVRFQGGHNAGHTLVIGDDECCTSIPSGTARRSALPDRQRRRCRRLR